MREFSFPGSLLRFAMAACLAAAGGGSLIAQTPTDSAPLSGEVLQRKLAEPVGVSWSGASLGDATTSITRNTRVCIWLDRRVDRGRRVEWSSSGRPLRETIERFAAAHDLGTAWIGSVAYLGPKAAATNLPTLISRRNADAAALPPNLRTAFAERAILTWNDLAEPRGLLTQIVGAAGWSIENEATIPHDLWNRLETPPLTLTERLSLLTAGFELTYQLDPATKKITLGPWPADLAAPVGSTTTSPKPAASATGTAKPAAAPAGVPGRQAYTLRVKDVPLSKLIEVLRQKHGLKIRVDDKAIAATGLTLEKATAVDVQQATLQALLEQAAAPLGLQARQDGDTVVVEPKK